ncbi:Centromere/kinetochore Zw10-domain-containing protein [Gigaspora rosea]|uniref:Centromere/kinetochore Zw10-domain-containing protein n=1 Tax=Gigaspora rosea TaxID=44941 RepID=A0A397VW92_9GLOM|nr:Centromere/kinetochore Zw10-domain-containing protein [Gigaspora rosea]
MPPINLTAVPIAFINAVLKNENEDNDRNANSSKSQQNKLLTSSAEKEIIFACIQRIDDKIRDIKAEVYRIILNRQDIFIKLYNESIFLRNKIDAVFTEIDNVSREINDSEVGMKPKLITALQENRIIMREVHSTRYVVETLEYLIEVQNSAKLFHEYLTQGRIEEAAASITNMDRLLESPPIQTDQKIHIFEKLKEQLATMKETLDQSLDDLLTESISFQKLEDDTSGVILTILSSVQNSDSPTLLTSVFTSLSEIGSINVQLSRLKKNVMKYLIIPLLKNRDSFGASFKVDDDFKSMLYIGPNLDDTSTVDKDQDGVFIHLITVFRFIYTFIFGGLDPVKKETVISPFATQYASTFGKFISHDLRDAVINEYLSHAIPMETSEFKQFEQVANAVKRFQTEMRRMGFMRSTSGEEGEERTLGAYVAKVDIHFTIKKRDKLLEIGRNIMLDSIFDSLIITEDSNDANDANENSNRKINDNSVENNSKVDNNLEINQSYKDESINSTQDNNPNEGWEVDWDEAWNDDDNWDNTNKQNELSGETNTHDPEVVKEPERYSISVKSKPLIDLTINTLNEARNLNAKSGIRLYHATLVLFDLYRAIMPVYHSNSFTNVPTLAMLFHNDCIWIADQLIIIQDQFINSLLPQENNESEDFEFKILYNDMANKLRDLGNEWYDIQLEKQKSVLKEFLDEMDGVQLTANEERFETCQQAMNKVMYTIKHLSKIWKDVLRPSEYYIILGALINSVLTIMIENLEDLYDISEEESHQLNLIYSMLFPLEEIFRKNGPNKIENHVKNWKKFCYITDILEFSLANIMDKFRSAELNWFTSKELEGLICALFADTTLREQSLQEIRRGHPVPKN